MTNLPGSDQDRPARVQLADPKLTIALRLAHIEGQVRGIQQMVRTDQDAEGIVHRINAAVAALREVALFTLSRGVEAKLDLMTDQTSTEDFAALRETIRASFRLRSPD